MAKLFLRLSFVVALCAASYLLVSVTAEPNPAYVCSFCAIALGLFEQAALQIRLETFLASKCDSNEICTKAVHRLMMMLAAQVPPDDICAQIGMCSGNNGRRILFVWCSSICWAFVTVFIIILLL